MKASWFATGRQESPGSRPQFPAAKQNGIRSNRPESFEVWRLAFLRSLVFGSWTFRFFRRLVLPVDTRRFAVRLTRRVGENSRDERSYLPQPPGEEVS